MTSASELELSAEELLFVKRLYRTRKRVATGFWIALGTALASLLLDALR